MQKWLEFRLQTLSCCSTTYNNLAEPIDVVHDGEEMKHLVRKNHKRQESNDLFHCANRVIVRVMKAPRIWRRARRIDTDQSGSAQQRSKLDQRSVKSSPLHHLWSKLSLLLTILRRLSSRTGNVGNILGKLAVKSFVPLNQRGQREVWVWRSNVFPKNW